MAPLRALATSLLVVALVWPMWADAAQKPESAPEPSSFATQAAAITVDAVALDENGQPVADLKPEDFTVLEDGKAQTIVGFEARNLTRPPTPSMGPDASPIGATNVGTAGESGRVLVILVDDMGIAPPTLQQLRPALEEWLRSEALPRDEITIVTVSGDVWWSDVVEQGREDLIAALERVTSKLPLNPVQARLRFDFLFGAIAHFSRGLADLAGRKSILLVSEDLADPSQSGEGPYRTAVGAAQRANTAVYFLVAGGLPVLPGYSAANGGTPRPQSLPSGAAMDFYSLRGAQALVTATGGVLTRSNDLAAGLDRMARESSVYYLLGYQPQEAPDGRWHDLKVRVARDGVTVRARRRYLASRPEDLAGPEAEPWHTASPDRGEDAPKRPLDPALLAGAVRDGLPLRLATYLAEPLGDRARVRVVLEVDNSRVHVDKAARPWRARLDVTILAASPEREPIVPVDEHMDLSLSPAAVGTGWWMLARDASLPPGHWQIRALVRDTGGGTSGLVTQRISVPDLEQPYVSSLTITDRALPSTGAGDPGRLVPAAEPRFGQRGDVVCQYEVYGFGGRDLAGVPRLLGGYSLQREGDHEVKVVPPTPIRSARSRAVRRIVLPLRELKDGRYVMVVTVRDALAQRTLVTRGRFVVDRDAEVD